MAALHQICERDHDHHSLRDLLVRVLRAQALGPLPRQRRQTCRRHVPGPLHHFRQDLLGIHHLHQPRGGDRLQPDPGHPVHERHHVLRDLAPDQASAQHHPHADRPGRGDLPVLCLVLRGPQTVFPQIQTHQDHRRLGHAQGHGKPGQLLRPDQALQYY